MTNLLKLMFNGKKELDVHETTKIGDAPYRKKLAKDLQEIKRGLRVIEIEGKAMKKTIESALAIALYHVGDQK